MYIMKKSILVLTTISLIFVSCEKQKKTEVQEEPQTAVTEVQETNELPSANTQHDVEYLYKADSGEFVEVDYENNNQPKKVEIKINDTEVELLQVADNRYEKEQNTFTVNGEEATLVVAGKEYKLTLISPLTYEYKGENETLTVTYRDSKSDDDKRVVVLSKDNVTFATLPQTSAWAKGAEYEADSVKWTDNAGKATLEKDGKTTTYERVNK